MSRFMEDAAVAVEKLTKQMQSYGFVYAHARGTGLTPWDAAVVAAVEEKGVSQNVLQAVRKEIDLLIEARNAA